MGISVAQVQTGTNITAATGLNPPVFNTGSYVYVRAELNAQDNKDYPYNPYQVVDYHWKTDASGNLLDSTGVAAVGSTVADIATDNSTPDTAAEWCNFYTVTNVAAGTRHEFHESELLDIVGARSVVGAEIATDWTDPS